MLDFWYEKLNTVLSGFQVQEPEMGGFTDALIGKNEHWRSVKFVQVKDLVMHLLLVASLANMGVQPQLLPT